MGLRNLFGGGGNSDPEPAADGTTAAELAELGREYAIAKRHGDRKAVNRITRTLGSTYADADAAPFRAARDEYDAIPPAYSKPRRTRRGGK
ncbi:hypothetical protein ACFZAV_42745 [Streptomyces sp. NPDC008343]|uniref:hypothetical protein n=1 Tax=Streptomyces sp. NPDC008343 TaxID=3364828 RepID=UPI0036E57D7A